MSDHLSFSRSVIVSLHPPRCNSIALVARSCSCRPASFKLSGGLGSWLSGSNRGPKHPNTLFWNVYTFLNYNYDRMLILTSCSLIAYPVGKLAAYALPIRSWTLPKRLGGITFSLNPGPFNIKVRVCSNLFPDIRPDGISGSTHHIFFVPVWTLGYPVYLDRCESSLTSSERKCCVRICQSLKGVTS